MGWAQLQWLTDNIEIISIKPYICEIYKNSIAQLGLVDGYKTLSNITRFNSSLLCTPH